MIDARDALEQLDRCTHQCVFPDLNHGYYYAVDARLHVYADKTRWALVVDTVGYSPRAFNLDCVVHTFGNCLTEGEPGFENEDFHGRVDNYDEIETAGDRYVGGVPLVVRGQVFDVGGEPGELLADTFRRLVPAHRDLLLADEAELRRRVPADLPLLLTLEEWHQPELLETLPSQSETFQQLAEVIATGDVRRYAPTLPPTTHWSHWPDSGSL